MAKGIRTKGGSFYELDEMRKRLHKAEQRLQELEKAQKQAREFAEQFKAWIDQEALDEWDGGSIGYAMGGFYEMAESILSSPEAEPE